MNEMRERLMKLIFEAVELYNSEYETLVDHLIDNGVIVSPVKVGQTVWYITGIYGTPVKAADVHGVYYHGSGWAITLKTDNGLIFEIEWGVDKVYTTREAAEEALKAREKQ